MGLSHDHYILSTTAKVIQTLAFYQRDGSNCLQDTLRMVDLGFLLQTYDYKAGRLYDKRTKCLRVPFKYTRPNFKVLSIIKSRRANRSSDKTIM